MVSRQRLAWTGNMWEGPGWGKLAVIMNEEESSMKRQKEVRPHLAFHHYSTMYMVGRQVATWS